MTDIPHNPRQQIAQAIQALQQSTNQSPLTKQATEILVTQLSGNALTIATPKGQRSIALGQQNKTLPLQNGGTYQARVSTSPTGTLLEVLDARQNTSSTQTLPITGSQLGALLSLPGAGKTAEGTTSGLIVKATVLSTSTKEITLSISTSAGKQQITVPVQDPDGFKPGQVVKVQLTPVADKWQVTLLAGKTTGALPGGTIVDANNAQVRTLLTAHFQAQPQNTSLPVTLSSQAAIRIVPELKQYLSASQLITNKKIPIEIKPLPTGQAVLQFRPSSGTSASPLVSIPLSLEDAKQLSKLSIPQHTENPPVINKTQRDNRDPITSIQTDPNNPRNTSTEPSSGQVQPSHKAAIEQLIRVLLPQTSHPSEPHKQLVSILSQASAGSDPATEQLFTKLKDLADGIRVTAAQDDPAKIKQLFTLPATPVSSVNLVTSPPSSGLVSALVSLLQITLSSRLTRQRPELAEQVAQVLNQLLKGKANVPATNAKSLSDLGALEQRHNLLKLMGKALSHHQLSKLLSAEQQIQNQDTFYYALPSSLGADNREIELLIRRETDQQNKRKNTGQGNTTWHLTMKLSVGKDDTMLAKARINEQSLDLDLYTSSDTAKDRVLEYMPWLKKRLVLLGIEIGHWQCSRGVIPPTLAERPYSIFQTQV